MKLCLDVQSAVSQTAGIGRYTKQLARNLAAQNRGHDMCLFYFDFKRRRPPFENIRADLHPVRWLPGRLIQSSWKKTGWPPFDFFVGDADVYHFPNFILPPLKRGKSVVTVHDLSVMRFPRFAENKNREYLSGHLLNTVAQADAVITISHFSAKEIRELLNVPADKVFAIYPGLAKRFQPASEGAVEELLSALSIRRPYLLTVGTLEPRKNIPLLIEMFEKLPGFDGDLVIAGMPGWKYEPILERMRNSPKADRIRYVRYVDDTILPALYTGAELFVLTSFYEGFGFPPLEAMACGTPVVSSKGGSLPEVLGKAALLVDGFEAAEWAGRIGALLSDGKRRAELVTAGLGQAAQYDWARTARETWGVYERILEEDR